MSAPESMAGAAPNALAPWVAAVGSALGAHRYEQHEILAAFMRHWQRHGQSERFNGERLERLHQAVEVGARHLALPIEAYPLAGFGRANDTFIAIGTELGAEASRRALDRAGIAPRDVDALFFTTVTGLATPTIDARLSSALGLRADVRRVPMFGLGCVGGAAGVARACDYLVGHTGGVALVVSVELCSLTLQASDLSIANSIATGLFGDGAAAAVIAGGSRNGPRPPAARVLDKRSRLYPNTERMMGWDVGDSGFKVVLAADLPAFVAATVSVDVQQFLADHRLAAGDVDHWICHPGGPKILEALERALGLPAKGLARARRSLREVGNLSSASVLLVLQEALGDARPGERGLMLAMGPGFCAEMLLLQWER